jgi:hypothetical protein
LAPRSRGFRWTSDNLSTNLRNATPRIEAAVWSATQYQAMRSENYMRQNARWTDRTSNARNGLQAIPERAGKGSYRITLTHGVPYGIWLEVRWSGKYGIIPESVRQGGSELMLLLGAVFRAVQA